MNSERYTITLIKGDPKDVSDDTFFLFAEKLYKEVEKDAIKGYTDESLNVLGRNNLGVIRASFSKKYKLISKEGEYLKVKDLEGKVTKGKVNVEVNKYYSMSDFAEVQFKINDLSIKIF